MSYDDKRFPNWAVCNVEQTEIFSGFLFIFITHKLSEHLVGTFTVS